MTKNECMKKYGVHKELHLYGKQTCLKGKDLRDYGHPYNRDNSQYGNLKFILQFSRFENAELGYGCYIYNSQKMSYDEAKAAYDELKVDWDRPGNRAWNSMNLIGFDEKGKSFSAIA